MAQEALNSDARRGHTIPAVELETHDPVDAIAEEHIEGWTGKKIEEPQYPIDVAKLTPEQRRKIVEDIQNLERLNQEANVAESPAVPLATAGGGNMQPPTEPANENIQPTFDVDALDTQVRAELGKVNAKNESGTTASTNQLEKDIQSEVDNVRIERDNENIRKDIIAKHEAAEEQEKSPKIATGARDIGLQAVESALPEAKGITLEAAPVSKHEVSDMRGEERWKHDVFGRLGARFERMGIKIARAPKWAVLENMRQFHAEGAAKIQVELATQKKEVERIEAQLAQREADAKARAEKMSSGGFFDRLAAAKLEREKQNVLSKLEKAKAAYGQTEAKLEYKNKKLAGYQEKLAHQADTITAKVDQRLAGDRADYETLTAQHEDLTQKLTALKQIIETVQNDLLLLKVRLKNKPEAAEKETVKTAIAETEKKLAELMTTHKNLGTDQGRIQAMANRAQLFLSGWDGMRSATK